MMIMMIIIINPVCVAEDAVGLGRSTIGLDVAVGVNFYLAI